ncbi:MAG: hypothetical protein H2057_04030 [Alphaproteobacteria bacterium]|nr:hypothetical protein [Alphaproteobacteria bacterium]
MKKSLLVALSLAVFTVPLQAKLIIKNENIPLEKLSPAQGMMSSNKNQPGLFDFPAPGQTKELPAGGNYFDLIIMPENQNHARCFLNKEDSDSVPYDQRKGVDAAANKTTTITVKWTQGSDQLDCQVTQN